jgi:uncharacterized membrane protein
MPENIRQGRNVAIILAFIEFACCFLSFGFYDIERSRLLFVILCCNFLTTAGGFYAKVKLSYLGLLLHACYNIPVIGGFYIYVIIAYIFTTDSKRNGALSDWAALLVTSIPVFIIFVMGFYSVILAIKVENELEARKKVLEGSRDRAEVRAAKRVKFYTKIEESAEPDTDDNRESTALAEDEHVIELLDIAEDHDEKLCAICIDAESDCVFYPCGHMCLCFPCAERFRKEAHH